MYTNGGARPGAGRPKGGISQARRLISDAIHEGLASAGRRKCPELATVDQETAAVATAAMIVDDLIQAGKGGDVLKLWATVAIKETDSNKDIGKNTLAEALSRLPGAGPVVDVSQLGQTIARAAEQQGGTTHTERDVPPNMPYFAPQGCLMLDGIDDPDELPPPSHEAGGNVWPCSSNPSDRER